MQKLWNNPLFRGVINDKAAALPKFSDMLTLSQPGVVADFAYPLALPSFKPSVITPLLLNVEKENHNVWH